MVAAVEIKVTPLMDQAAAAGNTPNLRYPDTSGSVVAVTVGAAAVH